jgi:hypothetical protein
MMLAWQGYPDWDAAVIDYVESGDYVSIADPESLSPQADEDCLDRRDRVYNTRAAFVTWLIERVGLSTVLAMPYIEIVDTDAATGEKLVDPDTGEFRTHRLPDYVAATGYDLETLEILWLTELWTSQKTLN